MTPERWDKLDRVWHAVLARPEDERAALVDELCAGDETLRRDVESQLTNLARASAAGFGTASDFAVGRESLVGRQLGPYAVQALLGVGGMGEVYRAHDSTLGRDVAIKIMPEVWLAEPDRRARFDREARLLASLNHPNIGAIYGVHESDGIRALVLELVEGETLAERIGGRAWASGPRRGLPIADVTTIAAQIAEALEAAHERGIIHRDLKPANIKITPHTRVKVLDFGLGRLVSSADTGQDVPHSPAKAMGDTQAGVLLGTASYMSPEQARGRVVDKRTDIWAFGCVLYEMLAGAPPFGGDGIAEVLASVSQAEPDWSALPADTPSALRVCLRRCLDKDLRQRFHAIADVRLAIEGAFELPAGDVPIGRVTTPQYPRVAYAGWAVAALVLVAGIVVSPLGRAPAELPETRLEIVTPPADDPFSFALSPDGRSVIFQAGKGRPQLWLRPLGSGEGRPLMGTEGATMPFWSPDSQSVGFFADGALKRLDLAGGFVRTLATVPISGGGAWNSDGTILIGTGVGPLSSIPANGGSVEPATRLLPGQTNHRWPQFLPGGRFLLFATGAPDVRGLYLWSLGDTNGRRVSDRESAYTFMPPVHVLLARQGTLWARRLGREYGSAEGEFVPVAPKILVHRGLVGFGAFSASSTGSIAYRAAAGERQLIWLDRTGGAVGVLGQPDDAQLWLNYLSADGRTAAVERKVDGNRDVWLIDTERGVPRRLTFGAGDDGVPIFSPDGSRVAHANDGDREFFDIHERRSDGTGGQTMLLQSDNDYKQPMDWSSDGRYILYRVQTAADPDLWALPLFGDRKPFAVARTPFTESSGRFSPDGRWVAYQSTETGRNEIYVQPFPGPGPKLQISVGGGTWPRWRRNGRELFYLAPDNRVMAVSIVEDGSNLKAAAPRGLFTSPTALPYEPSPDGQRFLVTVVVSEAAPITIILNWKPLVRGETK